MKKIFCLILGGPLLLVSCFGAKAQTLTKTSILQNTKSKIIETDNAIDKLVTPVGFDMFVQKKALNYLTGVSDLSLAAFFASYTTDNDKLNLGFNVPVKNRQSNRLMFLINPIVESDVKNSFATLYKEGKWVNNIRGGLKLSYLIPMGTMNFDQARQTEFKVLRTRAYNTIDTRVQAESQLYGSQMNLVGGTAIQVPADPSTQKQLRKIKKDQLEEIGKEELKKLEDEKAYIWMQTAWVSAWTFFPLTESEKYIAGNNTQSFQKTKFNLWEFNLQYTHLLDCSAVGTFYASAWLKYYQNNSANAELMKTVDYGQYSQFPGADPLNLALLETSKAYIGEYSEFKTTNLNLQLVYFFPLNNTLIKPGLSFRYEKNWGDFRPTNLRFGVPIAIQGKEKPINIELQYRRGDIGNYKNAPDFKVSETVGVSLGLPVTLLYK